MTDPKQLILLMLAVANRSATPAELTRHAPEPRRIELEAAISELVTAGYLRMRYEITDEGRASLELPR